MIIDIHTHYHFPDMYPEKEKMKWLTDRIRVMDYASANISVLFNSRDPEGVLNSLDACRVRNKFLVDAVKKFPSHYIGLASVPIEKEIICVDEIDKAVKDDGLLGVGITSSWFNMLSYTQLTPLYKKVVELGIPIFVHGAIRPILYDLPLLKTHTTWQGGLNLSGSVARGFELVVSLIKFIASGVLDEFPNLKIIFGGQSLAWAHKGVVAWFSFNQPYGGLEKEYTVTKGRDYTIIEKLQKTFDEYWNKIYFDTGGSPGWSLPALRQALISIKPERMVFGTDYAAEIATGKDLKKFIDGIKKLELSDTQKKQILGENARRLFKIKKDFPDHHQLN